MKTLLFSLLFLSACASKMSEESTFFSKYESLLARSPGKTKFFDCKKLDLKTSKMAMKHKSEIESQLQVMIKPNFDGVYRLVEIMGNGPSEWLLADCRTGKFTGASLSGDLLFSWDSAVVVQNPPNVSETKENYEASSQGLPKIYRVDDKGQFVLQENTIQKTP